MIIRLWPREFIGEGKLSGEFRVHHLSILQGSPVSPVEKKTELYRRPPTSKKHIKKTSKEVGIVWGLPKSWFIVGTYSIHIYAVGNPLNLRKGTLLKCEVVPPIFVNIQRVLDSPSTAFARIYITQYRYFWNKTETFGRIAGSFTAYRVSRFDHDSSAWVFVAIQQVWFCLFVRHKFQFFWTKNISWVSTSSLANSIKFPTLQFRWLKTQKRAGLVSQLQILKLCVSPKMRRFFKPPPQK